MDAKEILRMAVVLTVICVTSGLALSFVNDFTKEPREIARLKNKKEPAVKKVLAGYDNDPIKDRTALPMGKDKRGRPVGLTIFPAKKGGKTFAIAFETTGAGYGGNIGVMVGVDVNQMKLTGIQVVQHTETPGLGARIVSEPSFAQSFAGKPFDGNLAKDHIAALSGASVSTEGVVKAVNLAAKLFVENRSKMIK